MCCKGQQRRFCQIFVHGDIRREHVVAVVVPNHDVVQKAITEAHTFADGRTKPQADGEPIQLILEDLRRVGQERQLQPFEIPPAIFVESRPFTAENKKLTPTLKLNRPFLTRTYRKQLLGLHLACVIVGLCYWCRALRHRGDRREESQRSEGEGSASRGVQHPWNRRWCC